MQVRLNDTPEKKAFRKLGFPEEPFTIGILVPAILDKLQDSLVDVLKREIEVYKAFPKNNSKPSLDKFNPTSHKTCFMGLGFLNSGNDADLNEYRRAVGTINHAIWGNCTILEIWAADHYKKFSEMVTGTFKYCYHLLPTLPPLHFSSVPFIITKDTGTQKIDLEDKDKYLKSYLDDYNSIRATWGLNLVRDLPEEALAEFEEQWLEQVAKQSK